MNLDDDNVLEKHREGIENSEASKVDTAEQKINIGKTTSKVEDDITLNVRKIVENIENGDCPVQLSKVYVAAQSSDLSSAKAIVVLCFHDGYKETKDMELFTQLCGDCDEMSDALSDQEAAGVTSVAKAVENLVENAATKGKISSTDVPRLKKLYGTWMKGITWKKCHMSATNRPSLGSWNGWPWDVYNVIDRSLSSGVTDKNVIVGFQRGLLEDAIEPEGLPMFKCVWKAAGEVEEGGAIDVSYEVHEAIAATQAKDNEEGQAKKGKGKGKGSGTGKKQRK
jgi:hypothetical protein